MGNPSYGPLGLLALPYNLLFEAVGPFVEVAGYASLVLAVWSGVVDGWFAMLFFLMAVGYGVLLSIGSILLDHGDGRVRDTREIIRLLLYTVVENFGYRQLLAVWRVYATVDFMKRKNDWGEMPRKGFATVGEGGGRQ